MAFFDAWANILLVGNCSCVALDHCSRRDSISPILGIVPPDLTSMDEENAASSRGRAVVGNCSRITYYTLSMALMQNLLSLHSCGLCRSSSGEEQIPVRSVVRILRGFMPKLIR